MKLAAHIGWIVSLACVMQGLLMAQSSATVAGVVLDTEGKPVSGVEVNLTPTGNQIVRPSESRPITITDSEGRFLIQTAKMGGFRVVPKKSGYASYRLSYRGGPVREPGLPGIEVSLSEGTELKNLELYLARAATISGRVLDAQGRPANSASAALFRYVYEKDGKYLLRPVPGNPSGGQLNDRGEFRFYDLQPGGYYVGISVFPSPEIVSDSSYLYYPKLSADETKALPVQLRAGEDSYVGTLHLPPRPESVEYRVRVTAPEALELVSVDVGGNRFSLRLPLKSDEAVLRILPGHYDLVARDRGQSPNYYTSVTFDVAAGAIFQDLILRPPPRVTGRLLSENASGDRTTVASSIVCKLVMQFYSQTCLNTRHSPGAYQVEFEGLPTDAYVLSAKANGRDVLTSGLNLNADTELEVVFGQSSATINGTVRSTSGEALINATVVLVPDELYRTAGLRHRSVLTDPFGKFQIWGIAPGSYKLFAWREIEGSAFRNGEFMKQFEDQGRVITVVEGFRETINLTAL